MKWLYAILFILLGSFLFSLTIDDIGIIGLIIKIIIGCGCFFIAGFIIRNKKEKK
ncbi:hypothetical protein [Bacillus chungangensis]|uniref:DUF1328 domain-containing protein n=1 Tax=Bacillus chungangensis TaxID=587633 RepID=A0ABT9WVS4_9BACI|nr:hypothetical protein [Bacillus chungangensis]MDQ0177312.1 hypothetical protein [Bacillus chungangensis]